VDNNRSCLELAYRFIDAALENGEHVLVCCHTGLGKSAAVVLYYMMKKEGVSFAAAHRRVEKERFGVRSDSKTSGFRPDLVKLLLSYEQEFQKKRGGGGDGGGDGGSYRASVSLIERTMQYTDGKGIMDGGGGIGNGVKIGSGGGGSSSGSKASTPKAQSAMHVLTVVVVLVAALYGCLYLVIGKR